MPSSSCTWPCLCGPEMPGTCPRLQAIESKDMKPIRDEGKTLLNRRRGDETRSRWCGLRLIVSFCLLILAACAGGPFKQWGEEASLTSKSPSFLPAELDREQVAVLNAVVGFGLEGYSLQVSRSLSVVVAENQRPSKSISTQEALSAINREGLGRDYAQMVSEYIRSGILERDGLRQIGRALNVRYVFQPSMAYFNQQMSSRFSLLGLRLFQTRVSQLRLSAQLWDTRTGEIVWESSGEATLANEDVREFRIPFEEIARRLWRRMLQDLRE